MSDTRTPAPVPCYLVLHPTAGRALFRLRQDAIDWADHQTCRPGDPAPRWVSGGEHGWEQQYTPDGKTAATMYTLTLDGTLDESRFASYWAED